MDTTAFVPQGDSLAADSAGEIFEVVPWSYRQSLQSEKTAGDSTLRWQLWPDWTYKTNRDPGVISYRLGTNLRTNAYLVDAHEPRYQRLYWEDVELNDPVSGTVQWNMVPQHKISAFYAENEGLYHDSRYYLKQYYLNKPLTQLNYTESKYSYRDLDFMVTRNFSQKTNAELSYWDRKGGGEFANSEVQGRQIFARIYHLLDRQQMVKLHLLNNKYTLGQPFGYIIPDQQNYHFGRFLTGAKEARARSEMGATNIALNYYRRSPDTTRREDNFHAGIFYNNRSRQLDYSADTTFYRIWSVGASARKWLNLDPLTLEGGAGYEYYYNADHLNSSLWRGSWGIFKADAEASLQPVSFFSLNGGAALRYRSDHYMGHHIRMGAVFKLGRLLQVDAQLARGVSIPTNQQVYWHSIEFEGNRSLAGERILSASGDVRLQLFNTLKLGVKGQLKKVSDGIMVGADSTFGNVDPYNSVSVSPYMDLNSRYVELSASATYHAYDDILGIGNRPLPLDDDPRIWLRGSAYIKGYLFDRATFVKAGLSGIYSPFRYRAGHYNPVLDSWQPLSDDQHLPVFSRLDAELSARVRTIMFLLRLENALDDVNQLGYFETAQYPMSRRRFFFGIRVLFRN